MFKGLSENYKELRRNYISIKKDIETMNNKVKLKNTISEMNTLEGIKSRLHKAQLQISELEDKVEKTHS